MAEERSTRFEPVPRKLGSDWYVRVTHASGIIHVGGFRSEIEARHWIEHQSIGWLKKFEATLNN
jgi:hypothetical protein